MSRIACLHIPRFQIAVHRKHEPELKGKPIVILKGTSGTGTFGRARILVCSEEATAKNVISGMKLSEARAVCADVTWREWDDRLYQEAQKKLVQQLISCSPKVSGQQQGILILDASGLRRMGGESQFCRNVLREASKCGFTEGKLGIADSAFAAIVASRTRKKRWYTVPVGQDTDFLSVLSVKHLPISAEMFDALQTLGVKTMGQLIKISADALVDRFGPEGMKAYRLVMGFDDRYPTLPNTERKFEASMEAGVPLESMNEIVFMLKSMLERLTLELRNNGLWAEELLLSFFNSDDMFHQRPVKLIRPSSQAKFLTEVVKLALEADPIQREFTGLSLLVSRYSKETWEQTALAAPGIGKQPNSSDERSEAMMLLLQRFAARLGDSALVQPVPNDQHIPEFAGAWLPIFEDPTKRSILPINQDYVKTELGQTGLVSGLVLKRNSSPQEVLVDLQGSTPRAITCQGRWHRVIHITQPERLSGMWWETPVKKSYYVATIESPNATTAAPTALVLLAHDHQHNNWLLEGFYD
jgi:protein ImuB